MRAPAYEPGEGYLRLDQNTNPRPSPALGAVDLASLRLEAYGSPDAAPLSQALGRLHGLDPRRVVVANGSDQVLDILLAALTSPGDRAAYPVPSFEMYPFYCDLHHLRRAEVPLGPRFSLPVEDLLATSPTVTIVASPNNPTGNPFPTADLERLARGSAGVLLLDAAYADYSGEDYLGLLREHDNVAILRTLSKAYGLAGLRVGYALLPEALAEAVAACRPPYVLSTAAEAVALAALRDRRFVEESVALVRRERAALAAALEALGFAVYPSEANFLLVRPPGDALALHRALRARGILVRAFPDRPGLSDHLRITIGLPGDHDRLLAALKAILGVGR